MLERLTFYAKSSAEHYTDNDFEIDKELARF